MTGHPHGSPPTAMPPFAGQPHNSPYYASLATLPSIRRVVADVLKADAAETAAAKASASHALCLAAAAFSAIPSLDPSLVEVLATAGPRSVPALLKHAVRVDPTNTVAVALFAAASEEQPGVVEALDAAVGQSPYFWCTLSGHRAFCDLAVVRSMRAVIDAHCSAAASGGEVPTPPSAATSADAAYVAGLRAALAETAGLSAADRGTLFDRWFVYTPPLLGAAIMKISEPYAAAALSVDDELDPASMLETSVQVCGVPGKIRHWIEVLVEADEYSPSAWNGVTATLAFAGPHCGRVRAVLEDAQHFQDMAVDGNPFLARVDPDPADQSAGQSNKEDPESQQGHYGNEDRQKTQQPAATSASPAPGVPVAAGSPTRATLAIRRARDQPLPGADPSDGAIHASDGGCEEKSADKADEGDRLIPFSHLPPGVLCGATAAVPRESDGGQELPADAQRLFIHGVPFTAEAAMVRSLELFYIADTLPMGIDVSLSTLHEGGVAECSMFCALSNVVGSLALVREFHHTLALASAPFSRLGDGFLERLLGPALPRTKVTVAVMKEADAAALPSVCHRFKAINTSAPRTPAPVGASASPSHAPQELPAHEVQAETGSEARTRDGAASATAPGAVSDAGGSGLQRQSSITVDLEAMATSLMASAQEAGAAEVSSAGAPPSASATTSPAVMWSPASPPPPRRTAHALARWFTKPRCENVKAEGNISAVKLDRTGIDTPGGAPDATSTSTSVPPQHSAPPQRASEAVAELPPAVQVLTHGAVLSTALRSHPFLPLVWTAAARYVLDHRTASVYIGAVDFCAVECALIAVILAPGRKGSWALLREALATQPAPMRPQHIDAWWSVGLPQQPAPTTLRHRPPQAPFADPCMADVTVWTAVSSANPALMAGVSPRAFQFDWGSAPSAVAKQSVVLYHTTLTAAQIARFEQSPPSVAGGAAFVNFVDSLSAAAPGTNAPNPISPAGGGRSAVHALRSQ